MKPKARTKAKRKTAREKAVEKITKIYDAIMNDPEAMRQARMIARC